MTRIKRSVLLPVRLSGWKERIVRSLMPHSSACRGRPRGDKLMTEDDVRREIFQAIIQCRGHNGPLINQRNTCEVLAAGVFDTLKAKGLLKLDDDD